MRVPDSLDKCLLADVPVVMSNDIQTGHVLGSNDKVSLAFRSCEYVLRASSDS